MISRVNQLCIQRLLSERFMSVLGLMIYFANSKDKQIHTERQILAVYLCPHCLMVDLRSNVLFIAQC